MARLLAIIIILGGCSSERRSSSPAEGGPDPSSETGADSPAGGGEGEGEGEAGGGAAADPGAGEGEGEGPAQAGVGTLIGRVRFTLRDGTELPVAQPVVYWTPVGVDLPPLTDVSSCDCGFPPDAYVGSVDGRFTLTDVPAGRVRLVVQKGHFRRQRIVTVAAGEVTEAPASATELPVRHDPAGGDEIPKIVIGTGRFDAIEDVFAKLRLGPMTPTFGFDYDAYMDDPAAWGVTLMNYQTPRDLDDDERELVADSFPALLSDANALADWHFVFAPCAEYDTYGDLLTSRDNRLNIERYVAGGGRLYVTDFAYDVVEQVFPTYIDFDAPSGDGDGNAEGQVGDRQQMGDAAEGTLRYDSENKARDEALAAWLLASDASPDGIVPTTGNWVNLADAGAGIQCCDEAGNEARIDTEVVMDGPNGVEPPGIGGGPFGPSHDTWQEASDAGELYPHTLRFSFGCGQVMYSTYHTVDHDLRSASLAPQELVLLWLILEIGGCTETPIKDFSRR